MAHRFIRNTPHLPVRDLKATLSYYSDRLGFTDPWSFGEKDGGIRRGDLRMLFGESESFTDDMNNDSHRLSLMWFVENIDEVYAEFKSRNLEIADELRAHSYGLMEFAFRDINGYYIRIAEPIPGSQ
ncbi:MAG TPA: VOC family protein [Puia sp.]|nr:VOC family protein [Puia sp.]